MVAAATALVDSVAECDLEGWDLEGGSLLPTVWVMVASMDSQTVMQLVRRSDSLFMTQLVPMGQMAVSI